LYIILVGGNESYIRVLTAFEGHEWDKPGGKNSLGLKAIGDH
jgi:hypothetical protein